MSDEPGHSEHEQAEEQTPKWGDSISPERQAELQGYLDRWLGKTDHSGRKGPFGMGPSGDFDVLLTGADVFLLAEQSGRDEFRQVPNLHLEGASLIGVYLKGAALRAAHLALTSRAHGLTRRHG